MLKFGPNQLSTFGDGKLPNPFFGVFCLVVVVVLALVVVNVRRSVTGRQMLAVRSNERAAAAVGINVSGTKMLAFGLAAFVAGLGGALSGYNFGSVTALTFGSIASMTILAFAYLGGISSVTGAVIGGCIVTGGIVFTGLEEWFHVDQKYSLYVGGLGLIITAILNPEGIAGAFRARRSARHAPRRRGEAKPDLSRCDAGTRGALMALLETTALRVTYGGLRALDDVDVTVEQGQLVGLIGPNGAGKTTFIDALTGFTPATGGIRFADQDITGLPAHRRARLGLARTWQSLELFDDLTVVENLQVAADRQSARRLPARPGPAATSAATRRPSNARSPRSDSRTCAPGCRASCPRATASWSVWPGR